MIAIEQALSASLARLANRRLARVDVAVVDTGVDASHPDLCKRVAAAWQVVTRRNRPAVQACPLRHNNDAFGHGTGVAGIVAAVAPNARLFDVRVLDFDGTGTAEALLEGFRLAIRQNIRLINLSLACQSTHARQLHELCEQAYRRNLVVVAAKRNMPLEDNGWPAELSCCISVDRGAFRSPFMLRFLRRPPIEFAARGTSVLTTAAGGGYKEMTGTSFATPTVTGLCSLLLGAFPDLRPFELKTLLKHAAQAGK